MTQTKSCSNQRPTQIPPPWLFPGKSRGKRWHRDPSKPKPKNPFSWLLSHLPFSWESKRKRSTISNDNDNNNNNNRNDNNQSLIWLGSIADEAKAEAPSPAMPLSFSPSQIELNDFFFFLKKRVQKAKKKCINI